MLKNYFKIALRKMRQHKFYSLINIGGLAVGMTGFLLISIYVHHETHYDKFHEHGEHIYRIYRIEDEPSGRVTAASTPRALPNALINDYPDLKHVVSILSLQDMEVKASERVFQEKVLVASSNFFDTFDFPFVMGSKENLSENMHNIVITQSLANKLFGQASPMGKTITVHNQMDFTVAGVIKDVPTHSSFQFNAFVSKEFVYKFILPDEESKWYSMGVETFVELSPDISPASLESQLPSLLEKYLPDYLQGRIELKLQPLKDIHNNTQIISNQFPAVSKGMLGLLFLIACAILGIASMNFINLTTARYTERQKEIGMRKVVGAKRVQLIHQFLSESVLMTLVALMLSYVLVQLMLPYFNAYVQHQLTFNVFEDGILLAFSIGFGLAMGIINGLYPAFLLSGYKPISILRSTKERLFGRMHTCHILITLQFAITIALIFCVIAIHHQIQFMKHHDLGFRSENLIAISTNTHPTKNVEVKNVKLLTEILQNQGQSHGIVSAAYSENVPGSYFPNQFDVIPENGTENDRMEMVITRSINEDFFKTYQMDIAQGRYLSKKYSTDATESAVINETAARMFSWDDPVGKRFRFAFSSDMITVVGVIKDIHFRSLQNKIEPLVLIQFWGRPNFITVRVQSDKIQSGLAFIRQEWQKALPEFLFKYDFVEDMYQESYKEEERILSIISTFAALAIGLASLGLLGLSALIAVQRTKEIGIRKTLGAPVSNIILMLAKDLTRWVVLANFVALPVAGYAVYQWLLNFPYRTALSWWLFALAGLCALLIALATVSYQAVKAATANPVESLRYE